jgi:hypothetical protein
MKNLYEHRFENIDIRTNFITTFLLEMPEKVLVGDSYNIIVNDINELMLDNTYPVTKIQNNLYKIEGNQIIYYWYGTQNNISLGIELEKRPQALVVRYIGKNPELKGRTPFASELYNEILKDQQSPIRLMSDDKLSDEGYGIWKKLFSAGHRIGVYNKKNPGHTFQKLSSQEEMDNFFGMNKFSKDPILYKNYQYVILESSGLSSEAKIFFSNRRIWEINNSLNPGVNCTGGEDFDLSILEE